jgi:ketosteroid isomerase-like protein
MTRRAATVESSGDDALRAFLARMREASQRFTNGDNALWKELCSHADDATIAGGWGDYEVGWDEVGTRYDWAAARFAGGDRGYEPVAMGVSGDLAYAFGIERGTVRLVGVAEPAPMALRVTHVYRRENGEWKLLHRHADPLMGKTPPEAVVQR